jgi:uncharacterized protein (UPF0332 family)
MTLQKEDRNELVTLRLQRAGETLAEAEGIIKLEYWRAAANRLYYACYYAAGALLVNNGLTAHTHTGVINQIGLHFVKTGKISVEQGKFYQQLFELRQTGDYSDWYPVSKEEVISRIEPAKQFIETIEKLIGEQTNR